MSGERRIRAVGDPAVEMLEGDDRRGFSYDADLSQALAENPNLEATVYSIYGEAPNFLDRELNQKIPLTIVDKEDAFEISIEGA